MLFNSYEFIFVFLPVTLAGFFLLGRLARPAALTWLIAASLCFYAWWRPINVLIIAPSIAINFTIARTLLRLRSSDRQRAARAVLLAGIAFNIAFLGYFKYANFFLGTVNDVFGAGLVLKQIILPLGISFITFQKIAFLVDVHAGRVQEFSLLDYCLFVLFFPQLIAGPIVHYREMMPQFHRATCRWNSLDASVGITLFAFGLFKKAVLADSIAPLVTTLYGEAGRGTHLSLVPAWMAAVGFTFQIYFDFSGYTDMALGLARFVGIRFPPNFNSPLKASSIIDFWLRWHMTLTRFLTAYIYNPLVLWLTRRRMSRGQGTFGGQRATAGAFVSMLVMPTVLTMLVSGLWHGAGYLFILWGLVHGLFLAVNHAWRRVGPRYWTDRQSYARFMKPAGFLVTFACVAAAMVLFRSTSLKGAIDILEGMIGLNGVDLPPIVYDRLRHVPSFIQRAASDEELAAYGGYMMLVLWVTGLGVIAFLMPNTLQILSQYEPALGVKAAEQDGPRWLRWRPSPAWAVAISLVAALGIYKLGGKSEFLYWQF